MYCRWQEQGRHGGGELPKLKGINRRYLRPPKSATAADGVIGTAIKSCIHKHPTHLDQRPLRLPKQNNAILFWISFGSLLGLWSGYVRCLCAFSWLFSNDNIGGRGRLRRPEIVLQQEQTSVINTVYRRWSRWHRQTVYCWWHFSPVSLIPAKNCLPVSTTPLINFSAVSATPAIRESCLY